MDSGMYSKTRERGDISKDWTSDLDLNHLLHMHEIELKAVYSGFKIVRK